MKLFNLQHPEEQVSFAEAVKLGMGRDRGLFFPTDIPRLSDVAGLLRLPFVERSCHIIDAWIGSEIGHAAVRQLIEKAFNFPLALVKVDSRRSILELFHGPTLAFKDFGARFMAQCLSEFAAGQTITILTATSGDTGAAVAHAFYGLPGIKVVVLYPDGKISPLQEKLFCTLGGNIHTVAVNSDFDACQELVKKAFVDAELQRELHLNSANSINISRLLAQVCYYFEAVAASDHDGPPVVAVPSGNFGNLTAGLLAQAMGLPIKRFIAATNCNDTVPRYLSSGVWSPATTVATSSNAMDVSAPSNWPRVEEIFKTMGRPLSELSGVAVSEEQTRESLRELYKQDYLSEPHAAVAAYALQKSLQPGEHGIFLGTAHPAKFKESVEQTLSLSIDLPAPLQAVAARSILSKRLACDFNRFKDYLLEDIAD
ncbi:MAG: threonine synthase [Candidatus Riflebacteria bacterium HGW-Riflebacteria-2]|jgi:threonine synthase|nr:MAG: threonine synthase [Candidatus Riflebacteria bacterium HGW-Riflebacteria-2]